MALYILDTSSIKYRIRKCCECPNGLEYTCLTCFCDLCSECRNEHVFMKMMLDGYIHTVIEYREKFMNLKNHEICLRHQNGVYNKYCEFCNTPICFYCTDHEIHTKTDLKTAYETKRRQNKRLIKNIEEDVIFCLTLFADIELDFKILSDDVTNINSELLTLSENLTGCINNLLHNAPTKSRCSKQMIKMHKRIASTQLYEHTFEHSSIAPVKFLLSVKKTHNIKMKDKPFLKHHGQATLTQTPSIEYIVEKLPTIKLTRHRKCIQFTDIGVFEKRNSIWVSRIKRCIKSPKSMLTLLNAFSMLYSKKQIRLQPVVEYEKTPFPYGPVSLQQKRKFTTEEILLVLKEQAEEMIKRNVPVDFNDISFPNVWFWFEES